MPGGLIGTGLSYQQNALAGFMRESAEQQAIDEENKQIQAQRTAQMESLGGEAVGVGLGAYGLMAGGGAAAAGGIGAGIGGEAAAVGALTATEGTVDWLPFLFSALL